MNRHGSAQVGERQSPAETAQHWRLERDRHVAFAFAAADLLIEVGLDGIIIAASGATHAVLGVDIRDLVGIPVTDFVAASDRPFVRHLLKQVRGLYRIDPTVVHVVRADGLASRVLLGGCRLPDRAGSVYLSVTLVPDSLTPIPQPRDEATGLLTADALRATAQRLAQGQDGVTPQLQLVQLDGVSGAARQLPADQSAMLLEEIGAALRASSVGGDAAGRLSDDAFGVVTKAGRDPDRDAALVADLANAIRGAGIPEGEIGTRVARIDLALGGLSDRDVVRALTHAMNTFVKSRGESFDIKTLQDGIATALSETVSRFTDIRQMLAEHRFTLVYQPVVDFSKRAIHHYEALSRFPDGANTFDTVVFSEDVGLIAELDLIVCAQAIRALEGGDNIRVAVNLSGRSVQNDAFRTALSEVTKQLGDRRDRLLFELTESAEVENFVEAAAFLAELRRLGHDVCLDDFGAGAAAYSYLRRFDVDFLKIDGPILKAAANKGRERALIRSICVLCHELGCKVIGEMIENENAAFLAAALGVDYGQGWLFGRPVQELPVPIMPPPVSSAMPSRRS